MSSTVADTVVFDFGDHSFEEMLAQCARDDLWPIIETALPPQASILEAGGGSGRWMKFLSDRGYRVTGTELSTADVARFRAAYPEIGYDIADIRALPYADASFDAVLSLGVFEHIIDGPGTAAAEMARVLKPGGLAFFTVPHANMLFRMERVLDRMKFALLRSHLLRRMLGRQPLGYVRESETARLRETRRRALPDLPVKFQFDPSRGVSFYEYRYTVAQAEALLTSAGFMIEAVHLLYGMDRIHQLFGRAAASVVNGGVRLNLLGQAIDRLLPKSSTAHMVLLVARVPAAGCVCV